MYQTCHGATTNTGAGPTLVVGRLLVPLCFLLLLACRFAGRLVMVVHCDSSLRCCRRRRRDETCFSRAPDRRTRSTLDCEMCVCVCVEANPARWKSRSLPPFFFFFSQLLLLIDPFSF